MCVWLNRNSLHGQFDPKLHPIVCTKEELLAEDSLSILEEKEEKKSKLVFEMVKKESNPVTTYRSHHIQLDRN